MITLSISGRITDRETNAPLAGIRVVPSDEKKLFTNMLGSAVTAADGSFTVNSLPLPAQEFCAARPVIFFDLFRPDTKKAFYRSAESWSFKTREEKPLEIKVPWQNYAPVRNSVFQLTDANGKQRESYQSGEEIIVNAQGLRSGHVYEVQVQADDKQLFSITVMSSREGNIGQEVIWPQAGLADPNSERIFTVEEARKFWEGRTIGLTLLDNGKKIKSSRFVFDHKQAMPLVLHTDSGGRVLNALEAGRDKTVHLSVWDLEHEGEMDIFLVPSQQRWQVGDRFTPVTLPGGKHAITRVDSIRTRKRQSFAVFRMRDLQPGAYDFIVRPLRYGYDIDREWRILPQDILAGNLRTGLVIREEFMTGKFAKGGCVNKLDITGRTISGSPYFQYANFFEVGEDVYLALDPNIVDPANAGKMCAAYVMNNKTQAQWNADNSLAHLAVLGGNNNTVKFLVQSGCINANKRLVWAGATEGNYDAALDFGNNTANAASFVPDHHYDSPLDIIDGYTGNGFVVLDDPTTVSTFPNIGSFDYSEATKGTVIVDDEQGFFSELDMPIIAPETALLRARVMFPADVAGANTAAQISNAKADYPLIIIAHGQGHNFQMYDYLLSHFAHNGFIAASVHLTDGMHGLGRANLLLAHIPVLKGEFGSKLQNNIGIMGHSRGGEGVVKAARVNNEKGLGHNIKCIISLAPTDQYGAEKLAGPWSTPYLALHGSMDGDVRIFQSNPANDHRSGGPSLYDRTAGSKKTMVFIYGATHNGFVGFNEGAGGSNGPSMIPPDAQQTIAKGYMNAFFRMHLFNETKWEGMFRSEWKPKATTLANGGNVKLFLQYQHPLARKIDTFEGTHDATSWQTSTIGGSVSQTGLVANPVDNNLFTLDSHSAHDTAGLHCEWNSTNDRLEFTIPAAFKNVTTFTHLSFRMGQRALHAANPANLNTNLRVALRDSSGQERAIRVSAFGVIPFPHQRAGDTDTLTMMHTIRIPLSAYTIKCAGLVSVNLTDITHIKFLFSEQSTGAVAMDDLCFTL